MKLRVTIDAQDFDVEISDLNERPIHATVDGDTFEVWIDESLKSPAKVVRAAGPLPVAPVPARAADIEASTPAIKAKTVHAPIPGVIISVSVKVGDMVVFGQELCILEAMKMKNLIRANRVGTIGVICVSAGDHVQHNQVLMEYTD